MALTNFSQPLAGQRMLKCCFYFLDKPEIKDGVRKKITSWINHETKMTCEAEGFPAPDITWTRNDVTIFPLKSQTGVRAIRITPKDVNDFGDYVCTAKNLLGSTHEIRSIFFLCMCFSTSFTFLYFLSTNHVTHFL